MKNKGYTSITADSRKVTPGGLFIAIKGYSQDGHKFIPDVIKAGAAAIIYEDENAISAEMLADSGVKFIKVDDTRRALAEEASKFYGNPSSHLKLVGITGTNGKTTTVTLLYDIFTKMGYKCGLLSTIANYVGEERHEAVNTTSDPITINSLMAEMVEKGCEYCFMEVSSIGVEQKRTAGLDFKAGIFSNLTHDHLDYHKTFDEYLRCKKLFFDELPSTACAITNIDDRHGMIMVQNTKAKTVTYSCRRPADHCCKILEETFEGMLLSIDGTQMWFPLIGNHNAYNAMAIYCAALSLGAAKEEILIAMSSATQVKGRLEIHKGLYGSNLVIDYAHTPDALENVLKTLREVAPERKLTCLFGCGGDRDRTKRPEMGKSATALADKVILTSDNSRSETTSDIIADIKAGIPEKFRIKVTTIEDRAEAIRSAILNAVKDETILLAGKGHEDYQILGKEKRHFDEREIIENVLKDAAAAGLKN